MLQVILDMFWDEDMWLPPNTTWEDLAPGPDKAVDYNDHRHALCHIPLALVLIVLRHRLEKYCFAPFGKSLGVKDSRPKKPPKNKKLELAYQTSAKINHKQICALAKRLDLTERQVERWWRLRLSQDKPSTLVKFCENMWFFTFYLCNSLYGLFTLWDKEWLWDIDQCFIGYPHQGITSDVWWYYTITAAFYWSLMITQFWDVRRKDFWLEVVHHVTTIILCTVSWICNLHRIGSLIIFVHQVPEIFLNTAKGAKYANYQKLCDCLFTIFTVLWIIARLGFYPFHIIWSIIVRRQYIPPVPYLLFALNFFLLAMHVAWTWVIIKVAYKAITTGQAEKDIRSSSSEISDCSHHPDDDPLDGVINDKKE